MLEGIVACKKVVETSGLPPGLSMPGLQMPAEAIKVHANGGRP
jgi:hypothetical protein